MSRSRRESTDPAALTSSQPLCRSTGGIKFDPTEPSRQQKQRSLEHCSKYWQNSCCNETHTIPLKLRVMEPHVAMFNSKCQALHEELTCSVCHPFVGTGRMDRICPDLCDDWFDACKDEFYTPDGSQALSPCYGNALIFPDELGVPEPAEHMADAIFRIFQEQSEEPTEFMLVVVLVAIVGLFVSVKFFRRWSDEHNALKMEEARRRQQEAYRQAYHLGKAGAQDDATSDVDSSDDDDDDVVGDADVAEGASASGAPAAPSTTS
ncbi:hypothetical protein DYB32_006427 [Aphanomyces invadans]|uniref:Folate receptor-like domain-containing protein n=1 Tax=Aphanomyces invadans TaxID=157072 RepID=A0A3R6ZN66_9STRA|nr:hypothetical protein DYB32_006427 [Aphanomyces invadans]